MSSFLQKVERSQLNWNDQEQCFRDMIPNYTEKLNVIRKAIAANHHFLRQVTDKADADLITHPIAEVSELLYLAFIVLSLQKGMLVCCFFLLLDRSDGSSSTHHRHES